MHHTAKMQVLLSERAKKDLKKLDSTARQRIIDKLQLYAADPKALANQVKKLVGDPFLRLRVGDYRVLFTEDGIIVHVARVGHRRDIYH